MSSSPSVLISFALISYANALGMCVENEIIARKSSHQPQTQTSHMSPQKIPLALDFNPTSKGINTSISFYNFINKRNDAIHDFITNVTMIMDFMTVTRIKFRFHLVTGFNEPVGYGIDTFSVSTDWILITSNIIDRKGDGDFFCPVRSNDFFNHFCKLM